MTNGQYFVNNGDSYKKRDQSYEKDSGISLELTKICNAKDYKEYVSKNKKHFNWKANPFFIKSEQD